MTLFRSLSPGEMVLVTPECATVATAAVGATAMRKAHADEFPDIIIARRNGKLYVARKATP